MSVTARIPKLIAQRSAPAADRVPAIPLTIFQTFEEDEVPSRMAEAAKSWSELNPAFTYRFFDAEDRRNFIATHFDPITLEAYDRIEGGAFRADFWRYCVLVVHGGVYADVDSICACSLLDVLKDADVFITSRAGNLTWGLYNGFICAVPRHPFLERAIARATDEILKMRPDDHFDGYMVTGPGNLGISVNLCLGRRKQAAFNWGVHETGPFRYRLFRKMPKTPDSAGYLLDGETLIIYTDYPEYRTDIAETGNAHWTSTRMHEPLLKRALRKGRRIIRRIT